MTNHSKTVYQAGGFFSDFQRKLLSDGRKALIDNSYMQKVARKEVKNVSSI